MFRPVALLNFPMIDGDLADLAVEFWNLTWNDERRHLPQETRLLLSMANADDETDSMADFAREFTELNGKDTW